MYGIQRIETQRIGVEKCGCSNSCAERDRPDLAQSSDQFVMEYYRNVSNTGWNTATYLFDPNSMTICKNKNVGNVYNFLSALSRENIKRANYDNLNMKWVSVDQNTIVINIYGLIQFVSFNNQYSKVFNFSETFIVRTDRGKFKCTQHMFDF